MSDTQVYGIGENENLPTSRTLKLKMGGVPCGYLKSLPSINFTPNYDTQVVSNLAQSYLKLGSSIVGGMSSLLTSDGGGDASTAVYDLGGGSMKSATALLEMHGVALNKTGIMSRKVWDGGTQSYWNASISTRMTREQFGEFVKSNLFTTALLPSAVNPTTVQTLLSSLFKSLIPNIGSFIDEEGNLSTKSAFFEALKGISRDVNKTVNQGIQALAEKEKKDSNNKVSLADTNTSTFGGGVSLNTLKSEMSSASSKSSPENIKKYFEDIFGKEYAESNKTELEYFKIPLTDHKIPTNLYDYLTDKAQVGASDILMGLTKYENEAFGKLSSVLATVASQSSVNHPKQIESSSFKIFYDENNTSHDVTSKIIPIVSVTNKAPYSSMHILIEGFNIDASETLTSDGLPQYYDLDFTLSSSMSPVSDGFKME